MKIWEIAGGRDVVILITKCVDEMGQVRSRERRVRDDDLIVGFSSECGQIIFLLAEAIQGFFAQILNSGFRGAHSIESEGGGSVLMLRALYWNVSYM